MDDPETISLTEEGIRQFVDFFAEKVKSEQGLPGLRWDVGERLDHVYFWVESIEYEEPISVPLNLRRATQPLEDLEAIKGRIYSSFTAVAQKLSGRRVAG